MQTAHSSAYGSLEALGAGLRQRLGSGAVFQTLNTRLIIQYGVNLKDILPSQNHDLALLTKITEALSRMGIRLEGGQP